MSSFTYRVGRVQKPHGLQGDVTVKLFRPRRDRSNKRRPVSGDVRIALAAEDGAEDDFLLTAVRFVDPTRVVLALEGVDRDAAERLTGRFLDLDPRALPAVLTDFADRTFGVRAVDAETNEVIGVVDDLRDNGAQTMLVLERPSGEEALIPYVDQFVVGLEGEGEDRVLKLSLLPGLIDLE